MQIARNLISSNAVILSQLLLQSLHLRNLLLFDHSSTLIFLRPLILVAGIQIPLVL